MKDSANAALDITVPDITDRNNSRTAQRRHFQLCFTLELHYAANRLLASEVGYWPYKKTLRLMREGVLVVADKPATPGICGSQNAIHKPQSPLWLNGPGLTAEPTHKLAGYLV